jgi:hypothetical protein
MMIKSPRDAATWAIVYRRRTRDRPRDRLLKLAGLIGTLLVHLLVLFGAIFGPAYELPVPPPEPMGNALLVRLIPNKPQPPPPPPIRGVPPKEHGPTHRGNTALLAHATHEASTAAPVAVVAQPPAPAPKQPPVVAQNKPPATEKAQQQTAAPLPPISLPKPSPQQIEQPTPTGLPPPPLSLPAVQVPQPVPPALQPEPVRKPQPEGTQPMPPLPSIALPTRPAQSAQAIAAPQMAMEKPSLTPTAMPSIAPVQPSPTPAAPPSPSLQPVPLPAQVAPTVNLQASATPLATPNVSRSAPQELGPVLRPQEPPALAPVPVSPAAAAPSAAPAAPALQIQAPKLAVPEVSLRPQMSPAPSTTPAPAQSESKPSAAPAQETAASTAPAPSPAPSSASANAGSESASTAPNASPQGSETGNPGQPNGVLQSPSESSASQGTQPSPSIGTGNNTASGQGGGTPGTPHGTYIQLKPRGDTEIMSHNVHLPGYRPTRFDQYWTPEGESSVDTALRHAVEKTTVRHTFNLPQGVRIQCTVMPLLPSALFGCRNPDPPAQPLEKKIYDRLNLPSQNASIPKLQVAAAATAAAPAAPVVLDNSAECAAARVSGGPMPPNCPPVAPTTSPSLPNIKPVGGSWVPASDQFH